MNNGIELVEFESQKNVMEKEALSLIVSIRDLQVKDPKTRQIAAGLMGKVAGMKKRVKGIWTIAAAPYKENVAILKGFFEPIVDALDAAREALDGKVKQDYFQGKEKARVIKEKADAEAEKARVAAEKAREAGNEKKAEKLEQKAAVLDAVAPVAPATTMRGMDGGTLSMKKKWRLMSITNPELVPDCYWTIKESLIREAIDAGLHEIPGCDIQEDIDTFARS